ncbi:MAG TPA: hypothetical protein VMH34_02230 [Gammaproteobacteria bacterium]|nr:hypothetical protein [Gammaproteobacteria bacterium]
MPAPADAAPRGRWVILAVFGLFSLPVLLAWLLSSGRLNWVPKGHTNYGTLIVPAIALDPWLPAADRTRLPHRYGEWTLALIEDGRACGPACADGWDRLWRIREALQGEKIRVSTAVILEAGADLPDPRALKLPLTSQAMQELRRALALHDPAAIEVRLVIIDYRGGIIMLYPPHPDMSGVLNDLKRLLRASKTVS